MVTSKTIQIEEKRKASICPPVKLWEDLDVAVTREHDYKVNRTDVVVKLVSDYVEKNSAYLYPDNTVVVSDTQKKEIKQEMKKIQEIVDSNEPTRLTTISVPVKLWSDLHIIIKRKLGYTIAVRHLILMLIQDYLEKKEKFLSPS